GHVAVGRQILIDEASRAIRTDLEDIPADCRIDLERAARVRRLHMLRVYDTVEGEAWRPYLVGDDLALRSFDDDLAEATVVTSVCRRTRERKHCDGSHKQLQLSHFGSSFGVWMRPLHAGECPHEH